MSNPYPEKIRIVEVGPRDGLQNEPVVLKTNDKVAFIEKLAMAGCKSIEVTSFVRKDRIPQMGDAPELYELIAKKTPEDISLIALVPNLRGLENAIKSGVKEIAVFSATSNTFNKKNINSSIDESLEKIAEVTKEAISNNIKVRGYISTTFGCPYEGETSIDQLRKVVEKFLEMGVYEVSLGDTIGSANPILVTQIIEELTKNINLSQIAMHFHDTRGLALVNAFTALKMGVTNFDSSAGGLGGCPYAKGATGNLATEDLVYFCHSMGIKTGLDLEKIVMASKFILDKLGKSSTSKYHNAYLAKPC